MKQKSMIIGLNPPARVMIGKEFKIVSDEQTAPEGRTLLP